MQSLEKTSSDSEMTSQFGTWKRVHGNKCGAIVEETVTSDEYVSLILISILNMYI